MLKTIIPIVLFVLCANGCAAQDPDHQPFSGTWHTTATSRLQAADLAEELRLHREEQATRIRQLNDEYQRFFESSMAELRRHFDKELQHDRITDAQAIADKLTIDLPQASLRTNLTVSFNDAMVRQRTAILEADITIAKARETYVAAYKDAKLKLLLLDEARAKVLRLSEEKVGLQQAIDFAQHVIEIVREREKVMKESKGGVERG